MRVTEIIDGLFVGSGPTQESLDERNKTMETISRHRNLDDETMDLIRIAWETGHDCGMLIERQVHA